MRLADPPTRVPTSQHRLRAGKGATTTRLTHPSPANPRPRFLYAFIGAGAYIVLTASVGLCGADRGNRCCLSLYTYLSGVQLLGQLALAVAIFAGSNVSPPPDVTGAEAKAWRLVRSHVPLARWFTVGVLAVQILSVLLAASLARVKRVALYDSEDDEDDDDYYERTYGGSRGQRRPLLNRSEEDGGVGGGGYRSEEGGGGETDAAEISSPGSPSRTARRDEWSRRMREKYGLDTSRFSYDPERPPPSRRGDVEGGDEGGGGRCAVM